MMCLGWGLCGCRGEGGIGVGLVLVLLGGILGMVTEVASLLLGGG